MERITKYITMAFSCHLGKFEKKPYEIVITSKVSFSLGVYQCGGLTFVVGSSPSLPKGVEIRPPAPPPGRDLTNVSRSAFSLNSPCTQSIDSNLDAMTGVSFDQPENTAISNGSNFDSFLDFGDITVIPNVQTGCHFTPMETATDIYPLGDGDLTWLRSSFNTTPVAGVQGTDFLHFGLFHFSLTFNLPWFRFQGMIKTHSILSGSPPLTPPLASDSIVANDKRNALIRSVASNFDISEGEIVKRLTPIVEIQVPEQYPGENSLKLSQLFDISAKHCDPHVEDFILCFMSNNTLDDHCVNQVLQYILKQKSKAHLHQLFQTKTPTVEAISQRFLKTVAKYGTELTLQALIDAGINKCNLSGGQGRKLLWKAASSRQNGVAKLLIQSGVDINYKDFGGTLLKFAARTGNGDLVELVLEAGAKVDGSPDAPPLSLAVKFQRIKVIDMLLKAGAKVDGCKIDNVDALEYAFLRSMHIYQMLLPFSQTEKRSVTVRGILSASKYGVPSLKRYLERNGYSGTRNDREVLKSALSFAIRHPGRLGEINTLLEFGVIAPSRLLEKVVLSNDMDKLELLLDAGVDITVEAISAAICAEDRFPMLSFLIESGANIEVVGPRALSCAIGNENLKAVKLLLRHEVKLDQQDYKGCFPMQSAARIGNLEILKRLFRAGGDVNAPPCRENHYTALHYAAEGLDVQSVKFLLEAGAQVDQIQQCRGMTLLEACLSFDDFTEDPPGLFPREGSQIFRLLLSSGAAINGPNVRTRCRRWNSALTYLILWHAGELIQLALDSGADVNQAGRGYWARTPIQAAAETGNLNLIKDLLGRGANINAPAAAEFGRTALQAACAREQPSLELIQFLLDNGAEVNADAGIDCGVTALQGAAIQGHIKIVVLLIENGADVNAEPAISEGRMALDGAARHGRLDMVKLLLNAGAKSEEEGESGYDKAIELAEEHGYYFMREVFEDHLKEMAAR
jgi:ankyrin repeat protein